MDDFDPVEVERVRRYGRPDWRRFVRPDWERFVHPAGHEAMRKEFALWDRAFEHPSARRLREQRDAEHRAEIAREALQIKAELAALRLERAERQRTWEAECAARKRKADLAWERLMAAFMRGDLARKANFNPDQPRDELGRWTDGGGSAQSGDDEGNLSNAAADEDDLSPQLVQDNADRLLNNHIIQNHVAKTDEELKARIRREQFPGLFRTIGRDRNGTFDSTESARDFISQTIANNPGDVARVASGQEKDSFVVWRFGYQTGREAIMDPPGSEIRIRPTYEVGVYIVHDPRADFGYRIASAYPKNFNPRTGR